MTVILVGMRREAYVEDVLTELKRPIEQTERRGVWAKLGQEIL